MDEATIEAMRAVIDLHDKSAMYYDDRGMHEIGTLFGGLRIDTLRAANKGFKALVDKAAAEHAERAGIMNAKLIFLDIDGVLNRHSYNQISMSNSVDHDCVSRLNRILIETDARIVLSSAWRYMLIGRAMSLTGFDYLLRTHGVVANRLVGLTPADEEVKERGWQIHQWRKDNDHSGKYVVIDDMDLHISPLHPFVRIDGEVGLTDADAEAAIQILGKHEIREHAERGGDR